MSSIALGHHPGLRPAAPTRRCGRVDRQRAVFVRRRILVAAAVLMTVLVLSLGIGAVGVGARTGEAEVAGTVTVAPGETLWEVAVSTAPDGVDPRQQLAEIRELNGLSPSEVRAWTVVLIPAP